jgi:hypothetical protein
VLRHCGPWSVASELAYKVAVIQSIISIESLTNRQAVFKSLAVELSTIHQRAVQSFPIIASPLHNNRRSVANYIISDTIVLRSLALQVLHLLGRVNPASCTRHALQ